MLRRSFLQALSVLPFSKPIGINPSAPTTQCLFEDQSLYFTGQQLSRLARKQPILFTDCHLHIKGGIRLDKHTVYFGMIGGSMSFDMTGCPQMSCIDTRGIRADSIDIYKSELSLIGVEGSIWIVRQDLRIVEK